MSYERPDPEHGAYTPPDDDDLRFDRRSYDPRGGYGGPAEKRPLPLTLIASAVVLLVLIIAVVLFYRSGVRGANDAPPVVGEAGALVGAAPDEAQPLDPSAQIELYDPTAPDGVELAPLPEAPGQRPPPLVEERPVEEPTTSGPPPVEADEPPSRPQGTTPADPERPTAPPPTTSGGAAVQIGAFSSREAAERAYAEVAASFPQFATGRTRGIEQVTTSDGRTVYRTTMNGFSGEQARAFCGAMRASGRDCVVR